MAHRTGARRCSGGLAAAAMLVAAILPAGPIAHAAVPVNVSGGITPATAGGPPVTVTLVTGDRVTSDGGNVTVSRDPSRAGIRYTTYTNNGHTHVIPSDAMQLLGSGRLDPRLFDITALADLGYDEKRGNLPVLVTQGATVGGSARTAARASAAAAAAASARTLATANGAKVTLDLPAVAGFAATVDHGKANTFWRTVAGNGAGAGSTAVWLDGRRQVSLDRSVPQIGAPQAWAAGFDGSGVTVAVLDTGIDSTHPDLAGKVAAERNFTTEADARDLSGHGTHVASTIAGSGAASGGVYKGVSPGATLLNGKVCEATNGCSESAILAGMAWAAQQGATVVNMSLSGTDTSGVDPLEQAVADLTAAHGTLFIIAAGNNGSDLSVGSPASADAALAVGAVDDNGNLASFSSRGPRVGDAALKPEITAPGVGIVAARSSTGRIGEAGQSYVSLNGTSMATPHVVGAAAILAQQRPDLTPAHLKAVLMGSARPNPAIGAFAQGAGQVDVARALGQNVTAEPPAVSLGRQLWPHEDDEVLDRQITYRNAGTADVTLNLTVETVGPYGGPAPAGMFATSATTVTVPAGGSASVTLRADTRVPGPEGYFGGRVVASADGGTGGGVVVRTPFAVDRTTEGYELGLEHTARTGEATARYVTVILRLDGPEVYPIIFRPGPLTLWVAKGSYIVATMIFEGPDTSVLMVPRLDMDRARSVNMDARVAKPVTVTVPDAGVSPTLTEIAGQNTTGHGHSITNMAQGGGTVYSGQIHNVGDVEGFTAKVAVTYSVIRPSGDNYHSPRAYYVAYFVERQAPDGFTKSVTSKNLYAVSATHGAHTANGVGWKAAFPTRPAGFGSAGQISHGFDLPFQRTEYYNTDGGAAWYAVFEEQSAAVAIGSLRSGVMGHKPGRTYQDSWNKPVFAPNVSAPVWPIEHVIRNNDVIYTDIPAFGDGAGHSGNALAEGKITLYRDGVKVGEAPYPSWQLPSFGVPAEKHQYRLELSATRAAPAVYSTRVDTAWTFSSSHVDPAVIQRLPLWTVSMAPPVDSSGAARAGRLFAIPVSANAAPDSAAGRLRSLTVEVSFDDGATWQRIPVLNLFGERTALLVHPRAAGFVSLRATASDSAGNTITQTVIRAYRTS